MDYVLKDKVAIITGAGRGIGRGIAKMMASEGAKVVVVDPGFNVDGSGSDRSAADLVVEEITKTGGIAIPCYESVSTMQGGASIIQKALDTYGNLDIVATCAGILRDRMVFNMSEEEWDTVIAVHLKGTFTVVKHACLYFRQQRRGRIITFSSVSGLYGQSGQANYGAAKDGIAGFTRVVARDMGKYGVTINSIAPSAHTRMMGTVPTSTQELRTGQGMKQAVSESLRGSAEDVAPFTVWLASDEASHVNGHIFYVTNGLVSLLNHPSPVRTIRKEGRWEVSELVQLFPVTIGIDLSNPAPPQPLK